MTGLTNEITIYFSTLAKSLRLTNTIKKQFVGTQFLDKAYRIALNLCLYLKTSLPISTPLTNAIIR